jgi:S1-C subfamily serine protease
MHRWEQRSQDGERGHHKNGCTTTVGTMRDGGVSTDWTSSTASPAYGTPTPTTPATPAPPPPAGPRRPWRPGRSVQVATVLVVLAALIALTVTNLLSSPQSGISAKDVNGIVDQKVSTAISQLQSLPPVGAQVYAAVRAGLVVIESAHAGAPGTEDLGTGIIIDTQGDILTALHVVEGGTSIKVTFTDGTASAASIKSSDPDHDIAVLTSARLPSVIVPEVLGGSAQIGDQTFAVGNPLGLVASLSAGVISGLDRSFPLPDGRTLTGLIQFDAAVNPGSSGGPLLNVKGQVIGIVTGLANPAGAKEFAGIGFAVPIATAGGAAGAPPR